MDVQPPVAQVDTLTSEAQPLADWSPERQLAHMLNLCEAQVESATSESDVAVDSLIKSFSALVESARALTALSSKLPPEIRKLVAADLDPQLDAIRKETEAAIVAFQFYDKLSQRLGHVRYSLSALAIFVCDRARAGERGEWHRLFTTLRRLYRTEEERQIFKMMIEGASAEEAREHIHQTTLTLQAAPPAGEVELF